MNPDKIIDGLSQQLAAELKAMTKAKDVAEKEAYSLCLCPSFPWRWNGI